MAGVVVDHGLPGYITFSRKTGAGNMVLASANLMSATRASKMGGGLSLYGRGRSRSRTLSSLLQATSLNWISYATMRRPAYFFAILAVRASQPRL